ncbi:unnamed protein product [Rotaria sp. Silwood2]|nr:unnamed protein product [Rotaria sp. Silwood2]CAF3266793.1 unnamed protein product [Rotaria sp. Silwood2]CAF4447674.1 unnamed protein product [Rotaria sp. Silwood2]CAF4537440.1 unnamed protein product [Rotaria sp. Silwood2]
MPKLTLDEFFSYTDFTSLTLAPDNSQSILIQTRHRIWDQSVNEYHLHLYSLDDKNKTLLTKHASSLLRPRWQGEWIAYLSDNQSNTIYLYSTRTKQTFSLPLGNESIHAFTLSNINTSLYFAARTSWTNEADKAYKNEWNDVIEYRDKERGDTIYRVNLEDINRFQMEILANSSLRVAELICSFDGKHLVFSTESTLQQIESMDDYEIYSIDLTDHSSTVPRRLTSNQGIERNLKWFNNESFLFTVTSEGSIDDEYRDTQGRLYSFDLLNGSIHRWADQFTGSIKNYDLLENGRKGLIILGQLNTETQVYTQQSISSQLVKKIGWNGTYESIVTTCTNNKSIIAFLHSSFDAPQEVYFIHNIDQLTLAQSITNENQLFRERNLPKGISYQWLNKDDGTEIEGILLYPPDKFQQKNLPLLVLIHGGPYHADLNVFYADWYFSAMMMATEGWLVLQPNYRGSSGYGDNFLYGVRLEMVSRPGKDILFGVDALIHDGIVDPSRLSIGGYSYGGYLTNWLITQTTRFNAAFTGAGAVEHVIDWGTNDMPTSNAYFLGGFPWQMPTRYQEQAAIFQLNKVKTPTHIVIGETDVRVPVAENYLLERSLRVLGIPTKLIVFPSQGHELSSNPWHEKIKVREELKWLQKYGHICVSTCEGPLISSAHSQRIHQFILLIFVMYMFILV